MNQYEMVVLIVGLVAFASVLKHRWDGKMGSLGMGDDGEEETEEHKEQLAKLKDLEDRIQVLERIVTDRNFDLKRQIDDLDRAS